MLIEVNGFQQVEDFNPDQNEIVDIDVGGTHNFRASLRLLKKVPASDLAKLFTKPRRLKKKEQNKVYIDRNGKYFGLVLDYLKNNMQVPNIENEYDQYMFRKELKFWKI